MSLIDQLIQRAREYEAAVRLGGEFPDQAKKRLDESRKSLEAQQAQIDALREAGQKAIETLAASRHLIGKYTPEHHWLAEHDQRIAELKAALNHIQGEGR